MPSDEVRNLLADQKVAAKIPEDATGDLHTDESVLRRLRSTGRGVNLSCRRLTGVMEKGGEHELRLLIAVES